MPWALVELDSNAASSSPVRLEFRGRPSRWKHFVPSRRPLVAQLPPGRGSDEAASTRNAAAPQDGEPHGGSGPGHLAPREALRVAAPRGQVAGGDMLLGQLRQSEAMHQHLGHAALPQEVGEGCCVADIVQYRDFLAAHCNLDLVL